MFGVKMPESLAASLLLTLRNPLCGLRGGAGSAFTKLYPSSSASVPLSLMLRDGVGAVAGAARGVRAYPEEAWTALFSLSEEWEELHSGDAEELCWFWDSDGLKGRDWRRW